MPASMFYTSVLKEKGQFSEIDEITSLLVRHNYFSLVFKVLGWCLTTVFVDTRLWKTKQPAETFPKFPSDLRVIDISDRNPPIRAR